MLPMSCPCAARQIPGKTRHAQQSTLRSTKAAKKKVGVINGHELHPHHRLQMSTVSILFPLILTLKVGKYGLESWHDFNMLCYFTPEKAQRSLVSQKTLCWELFENSHTSHGSISDLLMGKRIKSLKRWVEHGWAFIGAGFRSLLGHPTVRSTGIDTELGSVTSQLGRITCYKLQVWWCGASVSLDTRMCFLESNLVKHLEMLKAITKGNQISISTGGAGNTAHPTHQFFFETS